MKKAKQPFYWFYMLKTHTHMQISYKPVVQARHDFKIFMHTSKGKEVSFKFLFIQVKVGLSGQIKSVKEIFTTNILG